MVLDLRENDFFRRQCSWQKFDNQKKGILILGKGSTQGLEHTLTAEKMNSINLPKK